jgi:hypothetical protein
MNLSKLQRMLAIVCMGGMPLATVGSCDYGPGGGEFFLDRNVDGFGYPGHMHGYPPGFDVVVEEDYYVEDVYYEDYWYDEEYYDEWDYWGPFWKARGAGPRGGKP